MISWSFVIAEEIRRFEDSVSGTTENSVRNTFRRALLETGSTVRHSIALWTMWLQFESSPAHHKTASAQAITGRPKQASLQRAKQVFMDGLRYLPWSKAWVLLGMRLFADKEGMSVPELSQVYDLLLERELRIRVNTDEVEAAIAELRGAQA